MQVSYCGGFSFVDHGLYCTQASVVVFHGLIVVVCGLWKRSSAVVVYGLSYPMDCGIFLDQIKLMSLHLQVDSNPWTAREALSNILSNIREELIPIIFKLFQNITEGVTLPSYFYKTIITLISKLICF